MISGRNITLRGLELRDVEALLLYWNDIQFMNFSGRIAPMSQKEALEWIRSTWIERKQGKSYTFAITTKEDERYFGNISLKILNPISRRADISLGIFIPTFRDKGLGTESLELIINFAFQTLNLLSLELRVFSNNERAIAVYKKLGFQEIGLRRRADFIDGEFLDDLMMDLLVDEWTIQV